MLRMIRSTRPFPSRFPPLMSLVRGRQVGRECAQKPQKEGEPCRANGYRLFPLGDPNPTKAFEPLIEEDSCAGATYMSDNHFHSSHNLLHSISLTGDMSHSNQISIWIRTGISVKSMEFPVLILLEHHVRGWVQTRLIFYLLCPPRARESPPPFLSRLATRTVWTAASSSSPTTNRFIWHWIGLSLCYVRSTYQPQSTGSLTSGWSQFPKTQSNILLRYWYYKRSPKGYNKYLAVKM